MRFILSCILSIVALSVWLRAEEKADGHGDGEITLEIKLRILNDADSHSIGGVKVTFFSKSEQYALHVAEVYRKANVVNETSIPTGITGISGQDGGVILKCKFDAAFLFKGRADNIIRTEVYPVGEFRLTKDGYESLIIKAEQMFPAPPYAPEYISRLRGVRLKALH